MTVFARTPAQALRAAHALRSVRRRDGCGRRYAKPEALAAAIAEADVLIGAVLEPGRLVAEAGVARHAAHNALRLGLHRRRHRSGRHRRDVAHDFDFRTDFRRRRCRALRRAEHAGAGRAHGDAGAGEKRRSLAFACLPTAASSVALTHGPGLARRAAGLGRGNRASGAGCRRGAAGERPGNSPCPRVRTPVQDSAASKSGKRNAGIRIRRLVRQRQRRR